MMARKYLSQCAKKTHSNRKSQGMCTKRRYRAKNMAKARLVKADKASISETASDQVHEATSTSTVDNEVISTPAESNPSVPVPNLENVSPTNASGERVTASPKAGTSKGYHSPRPPRRPQRLAKLRAHKAWRKAPCNGSEAAPDYVQQIGQLASVLQSTGSPSKRRCRDTVDILMEVEEP